MIYFYPAGIAAKLGISGESKTDNPLTYKTFLLEGEGNFLFNDDEFEMLKNIIQFFDIKAKFVTNFRDLPLPQAYLNERDESIFVSFSKVDDMSIENDKLIDSTEDEDEVV